jgi:hypothetical protein
LAVANSPLGCPPLTVGLAIVAARSRRQGLDRAGRFAPFCSRVVVVDRPPRDLAIACVEADFYGVGLLVAGGASDVEVLVAPEPYRVGRVTARAWWFAEEAYRAYLTGILNTNVLRPAGESARG